MTDWPVKTLGEVCDFVRGVTYDKADARSEMKSGFIPLLRATNITEKGLLRDDFVFVPKNGVRADQKLRSGDALITIASGSASVVGRSVLVEDPGEMTFGAFCGVLRPRPEILPRYLSHFMSSRSVRAAWSEAAQGTNINNLKRDDILQTECLLPPLEEQKRIVELLDAATSRVTELTACYEQARTHANNLFTSALSSALEGNPDWPVKTLNEVCELQRGHDLPTPERREGNVPILGSTGVTGFHNVARYRGPGVAIGRSGFIGGAQFCESSYWPLNTCLFVRDFFGNDPKWVYYFLKSIDFSQYNSGTTQPSLNRNNLNGILVKTPPISDQQATVLRLDAVRAKTLGIVDTYDAKLTSAKNLRQSILEAAFAGDL